MNRATQPQINCSICNTPVDLETAKTDDNGKAVHAECYIIAVIARQPAGPTNRQPMS